MLRKIQIIILLAAAMQLACNNYDLSAKLESPAGTQVKISVIGYTVPPSTAASSTQTVTVTFNRAVSIPISAIQIDNNASIQNLTTTDNLTWNITISFGTAAAQIYSLILTSEIADQQSNKLVPLTIQFSYQNIA